MAGHFGGPEEGTFSLCKLINFLSQRLCFFAPAASQPFLGTEEGTFSLCNLINFLSQTFDFSLWRLAPFWGSGEGIFSLCALLHFLSQRVDFFALAASRPFGEPKVFFFVYIN